MYCVDVEGFYRNISFFFSFSSKMVTSVISPKPIDQEPEQNFVGVIIAVLTTIILLLIAVILFIVARNKRSRRSEALNSLQFNFNQDTLGLGIAKRLNSNMKVIVRMISIVIIFQFWNKHTECFIGFYCPTDDK